MWQILWQNSNISAHLWNLLAAAGIIIMVPMFVLALIIQKHFVQGMTMGAVR